MSQGQSTPAFSSPLISIRSGGRPNPDFNRIGPSALVANDSLGKLCPASKTPANTREFELAAQSRISKLDDSVLIGILRPVDNWSLRQLALIRPSKHLVARAQKTKSQLGKFPASNEFNLRISIYIIWLFARWASNNEIKKGENLNGWRNFKIDWNFVCSTAIIRIKSGSVYANLCKREQKYFFTLEQRSSPQNLHKEAPLCKSEVWKYRVWIRF